jgi:hypothetical protein
MNVSCLFWCILLCVCTALQVKWKTTSSSAQSAGAYGRQKYMNLDACIVDRQSIFTSEFIPLSSSSAGTGEFYFVPALFGNFPLNETNLNVTVSNPANGCTTISNVSQNGENVSGKILLVLADGLCLFGDQALNVQATGAAGMMIFSCSPDAPCTICLFV